MGAEEVARLGLDAAERGQIACVTGRVSRFIKTLFKLLPDRIALRTMQKRSRNFRVRIPVGSRATGMPVAMRLGRVRRHRLNPHRRRDAGADMFNYGSKPFAKIRSDGCASHTAGVMVNENARMLPVS